MGLFLLENSVILRHPKEVNEPWNTLYIPFLYFYSLEERLPRGKQSTAANAARLGKNAESADTFLFGHKIWDIL